MGQASVLQQYNSYSRTFGDLKHKFETLCGRIKQKEERFLEMAKRSIAKGQHPHHNEHSRYPGALNESNYEDSTTNSFMNPAEEQARNQQI